MSSDNSLTSITLTTNQSSLANKSQGGVQSLEIGLSVLDVLISQNHPMMLKEVAQALQMHPAKCHRYLVSLIRKGYASQLDDGRYRLGARVDALAVLGSTGLAGLNQHNILERLTNAAHAIKDSLNCGVQIAKWFSEGPIIIGSVEPDSAISIITRIGSRMPLTTSATGQLFASYQADSLIKPLVLAEWQSNSKSDAETDIKWLAFTELQKHIRKQGYATVTGDMVMGINAITIPILSAKFDSATLANPIDTDNPIEYAITVIGTAEQLPLAEQQSVFNKIKLLTQRYQLG